MLKRGYIILIIGAGLLISGVVISAFWAGSFASSFLRQGIILNDIVLPPSASASNTIRLIDNSHPLVVQIHFEPQRTISSGSGIVSSQSPPPSSTNITSNNEKIILKEVVKDPAGNLVSQNTFSNRFLTTFKATTQGIYTLTISNLGSNPVKVGALFGPATFVNANNQINVNVFGGVIAGLALVVVGIITLIVGMVILLLDRRKGTKGTEYFATR